jgi:hypothetical protein
VCEKTVKIIIQKIYHNFYSLKSMVIENSYMI